MFTKKSREKNLYFFLFLENILEFFLLKAKNAKNENNAKKGKKAKNVKCKSAKTLP